MKEIIVAVVLVGLVLGVPLMQHASVETVLIMVEDKQRISTGSDKSLDHKYLVFTDSEVFQNTDTMLFFKYGSSNLQNKLKRGTSYQVKVSGWRVPFLSWYRNIISIKE